MENNEGQSEQVAPQNPQASEMALANEDLHLPTQQQSELPGQLEVQTPLPRREREAIFLQVGTELQEALEHHPIYAPLVFKHYWESGSVPEELRFNWNGYRWAVARTSDSSKVQMGQGRDREIVLRRRKDDGTERTSFEESTEENRDPNYWEERLAVGIDYESVRGAGGMRPAEPPYKLHDPEIRLRSGNQSYRENTPASIDGARKIIADLKAPATPTHQALPSLPQAR